MRQLSLALVFAPLLGAALACNKSSGPADGPAVVTFDDKAITADEVRHELSEQSPFTRARYQSLDKRKELLDQMIRLDLLADEAQREGFDKDPEVQRDYKKAMVQQWMRKKFNDKEGMAGLTDADLQAYYDAHKDEYQRPEKLRVQMIFYKIDAPGSALKIKAEATADQKTLAQALPKQNVTAFADKARSRSDDAQSKIKGGDLDFHTRDELAKLYGETIANALAALKSPTEVTPVLEGNGGLYVFRLEARQPAFNRAFDQVKETLRSRLWNERRNQNFEDFVKKLREQAHVKIDDAQLAKIEVGKPDLSVTTTPVGPPPGSHLAPTANLPGSQPAPVSPSPATASKP